MNDIHQGGLLGRRVVQRRLVILTTLAVCIAALFLPGAAASDTTAIVPPVASDCSKDVTDQFNAWLATVPDGSSIHLAHHGCYLSDGTIAFMDKHDITIEGHGAIFTAGPATDRPRPRYRGQLWFEMGSGIVVRDLTIQGTNFTPDCAIPHPNLSSCYGGDGDRNVLVAGTNGFLADNVHFRNSWEDALIAAPGPDATKSWDSTGRGAVMARNITIQNSTVDTAARHAFSCTGCENMILRDNSITNVGYWGVDVEVEAETWTGDVTLERNTFSNLYLGILATTRSTGPIIARDNIRTDAPPTCWPLILVGPGRHESVTIADNKGSAYGVGMSVDAPHADVTGNTIESLSGGGCGDSRGVALKNVSTGSVIGNTIINFGPMVDVAPLNATVRVCGNRTSATSAFDQPILCLVAEVVAAVASELEQLAAASPRSPLADKLEDALAKLGQALVKLDVSDRQGALGQLEGAVDELRAAVEPELLPPAEGTALMDRLAGAAHSVADQAIAEAQATSADPAKVAEAESLRADGDAARAVRSFKEAVAKYKDAVSKAEGA